MLREKPSEEKVPTTFSIVEKLITISRHAFLELDKASESKDEYKAVFPPGVNVKILDGAVKVCTVVLDEKTYTIFGVEKDQQDKINFKSLRLKISAAMKFITEKFSQIIGDSAMFSEEGTRFANQQLVRFLESIGESIILYGGTGNEKNNRADINGLFNQWLDKHPEIAARVIANIVDEHTATALREWNCKISSAISHFYLVYTHSEKPNAKFGDDTHSSDGITNYHSLCCEGGIQSTRQASVLLKNNVPITGIVGLRDLKNPRNFDPVTGLPFMSTAGFFSYVKAEIKRNGESELTHSIDSYFFRHGLYNPKKGDACTKDALLKQFFNQFNHDRVWKKLHLFQPIIRVSPAFKWQRYAFFGTMAIAAVTVGARALSSKI